MKDITPGRLLREITKGSDPESLTGKLTCDEIDKASSVVVTGPGPFLSWHECWDSDARLLKWAKTERTDGDVPTGFVILETWDDDKCVESKKVLEPVFSSRCCKVETMNRMQRAKLGLTGLKLEKRRRKARMAFRVVKEG